MLGRMGDDTHHVNFGAGTPAAGWTNLDSSPWFALPRGLHRLMAAAGLSARSAAFCEATYAHFRFRAGTTLPFADASLEAIYCSHVLEHLPAGLVQPLLDEFKRVLKPGGRLRLIVPDLEASLRDLLASDAPFASLDAALGTLPEVLTGSGAQPVGLARPPRPGPVPGEASEKSSYPMATSQSPEIPPGPPFAKGGACGRSVGSGAAPGTRSSRDFEREGSAMQQGTACPVPPFEKGGLGGISSGESAQAGHDSASARGDARPPGGPPLKGDAGGCGGHDSASARGDARPPVGTRIRAGLEGFFGFPSCHRTAYFRGAFREHLARDWEVETGLGFQESRIDAARIAAVEQASRCENALVWELTRR